MVRLLVLLLLTINAFAQRTVPVVKPTAQTARPWTYWWWMGSAVSEPELTKQLELMAGAGLGGVHIIPIYGVKGAENQFVPFLSARWLTLFTHTVREANRLGMGVDLTTGTGWPFGGPNVPTGKAAQRWQLRDGKLSGVPTGQLVKRAAPGGEGLVLDPFDADAARTYLARFDSTLVRLPVKPRAVYNDSYEVYGANWTPRFLEQFRQRRGYDLLTRLPDFLDTTQAPAAVQVPHPTADRRQTRSDYHETLADLLRDAFTRTWTNWANQHGYLTRHQAHGSPGNLLDLYALSDIPETESFGSSRFPIPGLRVDADYEVDRFGTPHPLAMQFAASAAHVLGKPLVSAETGTWLANHFKASLSQIKPQIDELFTAGINHVFYHGTTYSPSTEPWPGYLFYASTNFGPSSHKWPFLPLLNQYVTRCQTRLQASRPDNDLLVYFPIHDLWANRSPSPGGVHLLEVHHVDRWLLPMPFGRLCDSLRHAGYTFDYISDRLLERATVTKNGHLRLPGGTYRALLVPPGAPLPPQTQQQIETLKRQGVPVIQDASLLKLRQTGIQTESLAKVGLSFNRKRIGKQTQYFVANLDSTFREGYVRLSVAGNVVRYDPLTEQTHLLHQQDGAVWLALVPGECCFLTVTPGQVRSATAIQPIGNEKWVMQLTTPWQVRFLEAKPTLPAPATLPTLRSWTTLSDSAAYVWGKAKYVTTFDANVPKTGKTAYWLDLGDVREVAEVRMNGKPLGTAWCIPFRLAVPGTLLRERNNVLEIDVSNLSANYMRLRDGQQPDWKKFYDINMVDITYRPFDARRWQPMPSGLLGPVRLVQQ